MKSPLFFSARRPAHAPRLLRNHLSRLLPRRAVFAALGIAVAGFAAPAPAQTITTVATFTYSGPGSNGSIPGPVTLDSQGNLYGFANTGGPGTGAAGLTGLEGGGTLWEIAHGTNTIQVLYAFPRDDGGADPKNPTGNVTFDAAGNFYGMTQSGGTANDGTVFQLSGSGIPTALLSFSLFSGVGFAPSGGVTLDAAGNLYGTTQDGGTANAGTVWGRRADGTALLPLASFAGTPYNTLGQTPMAGVTVDAAGNLYGTTNGGGTGGTGGAGTVWEIPAGSSTISTLALFDQTTTGYGPEAAITLDAQGNLYGTTHQGGVNQAGTVWKIAAGTSALTVVANFGDGPAGATTGSDCLGSVAIDGAGNLFGTTSEGGTANAGTVWEIAAGTHTVTILASFIGTLAANDPNGCFPAAGVVIDAAGNLFGTSAGGPDQAGTVWEMAGAATPPVTLQAAPGAPFGLQAVPQTQPQAIHSHTLQPHIAGAAVNLSWQLADAYAADIFVERKLGTGAFAQIADLTGDSAAYQDSGLAPGTYTYRVRAANAGGDSPYSNTATVTPAVSPAATTHILWDNTSGAASIWNYSTASGTFTQNSYGPYSGWSAKALADGGTDGQTRVLWDNANGMASLWSLNNSTGVFTQFSFGPYAGWTAKTLSVGTDNTTHVLWTNADGRASLWNYSTTNGTFTQNAYGPYPGWSAKAVADGADGKTRLLWDNTNGTMSLWSLDNVAGVFSQFAFGPYSGWTAGGVSVGADGSTHVLWDNSDGRLSLWNDSTVTGVFSQNSYGPYAGWAAVETADGSDGRTRVLWDNTNGQMSLWSLDNGTGVFTQNSFGPYSGWTATAVAAQ